jgi:MFS family permease
VVVSNFISLVLTAFAASYLTSKIKDRLTFLKYWILAGVLFSPLFAIMNWAGFITIFVIAIILGVYFGIGMPVCMGYFAKTTVPQNRAKLSGIIILLIGIGFVAFSIIGAIGITVLAIALAVWRILGLLIILPIKKSETPIQPTEKVTFRSVFSNKTFLLYVAPWFMFSLINDLTMQVNTNYFTNNFSVEFANLFMPIENVFAGASAIICGILADKKGRKRLALVGFVLVGLGYAALGLFTNEYSAWFYICVDGIAWGAFSMLFLVTIWGDIAQERSSEKYYLLGVLPYLFSNLTRLSAGNYIATGINESTVFSFASIFLFIALLPLAYAPETLSEKIIKNFDISSYVNKALEKAKKEDSKSRRSKPKPTPKPEPQAKREESIEESADYEEAKKIAEKYY